MTLLPYTNEFFLNSLQQPLRQCAPVGRHECRRCCFARYALLSKSAFINANLPDLKPDTTFSKKPQPKISSEACQTFRSYEVMKNRELHRKSSIRSTSTWRILFLLFLFELPTQICTQVLKEKNNSITDDISYPKFQEPTDRGSDSTLAILNELQLSALKCTINIVITGPVDIPGPGYFSSCGAIMGSIDISGHVSESDLLVSSS
jgi:hypothetical protein